MSSYDFVRPSILPSLLEIDSKSHRHMCSLPFSSTSNLVFDLLHEKGTVRALICSSVSSWEPAGTHGASFLSLCFLLALSMHVSTYV